MPGADELFSAFWELSTDRYIGTQAGPLPAQSIERYAERFGYDDEEFGVLQGCMRAMDRAYLRLVNKTGEDEPEEDLVMDTPMSPDLFKRLFGHGRSKK